MSFHEVRFPEHISYGSRGGPKFKTNILTLDSGWEQSNIEWQNARCEYDVSHGIKSRAEMDELRSFFYARRGRAYGFRFKDWSDYTAVGQIIGTGDGTTAAFQMIKTYASGSYSFGRQLKKIVAGTLTVVQVNGSSASFTLNANTGVITMSSAPAMGHIVTVPYCEFDVPVRFDSDHLDAEHDFWEHQSWNSIPLVEKRV